MGFTNLNQRQNAISRIPQADYLTRTPAVAANFRRVESTDSDFASYKVNSQNNRDHATGKGQATRRWVSSSDTERKLNVQVCSEEIGRFLLLASGSVVTSQPDEVEAPTVYKHVFKLLDLRILMQLFATTYLEDAGDAISRAMPSMVCEAFEIKGEGINIVEASASLRGSGEMIEPAGIDLDALDDLDDAHYFYTSQGLVLLTDPDEEVINFAQALQLNSWMFAIANELLAEDGYRPGARRYQEAGKPASGAMRSECLVKQQTASIGFNHRFLPTDPSFAALKNQTPFHWKLDLQGDVIIEDAGGVDYFHQLIIEGHKTVYETAEVGNRNGLIGLEVKGDPLHDNDSDNHVTITLYNETPSYTV